MKDGSDLQAARQELEALFLSQNQARQLEPPPPVVRLKRPRRHLAGDARTAPADSAAIGQAAGPPGEAAKQVRVFRIASSTALASEPATATVSSDAAQLQAAPSSLDGEELVPSIRRRRRRRTPDQMPGPVKQLVFGEGLAQQVRREEETADRATPLVDPFGVPMSLSPDTGEPTFHSVLAALQGVRSTLEAALQARSWSFE